MRESVAVFGSCGVVGKACVESLKKRNVDTIGYDIQMIFETVEEKRELERRIFKCDIVFLCLPTLYDSTIGEYNKAALKDVCSFLQLNNYQGIVVVKSTVEPGTTDQLASEYGLKLVHNPEFLTARTAVEDMDNQKHIVLGKPSSSIISDEDFSRIRNFFKTCFPNAEISSCAAVESECMKLFVNTHYATKVQQFNEFYLGCQAIGADYNRVRDMMVKNGWIHPMHTDVPGPDGKMSYGGMCFPKDTNACLSWMKNVVHVPHNIVEATIVERNSIRHED